MYPARQIYMFDCRDAEPKLRRDERRDTGAAGKWRVQTGSSAEFREDDYIRAQVLYQHLYLEKYTWLNPHYYALRS